MSEAHSRFPVRPGEPYETLPFATGGAPRGEMYLDVTPEMAADFLAHTKGGRRVRAADVHELAREMRAGGYSVFVRGNPFKFDEDGYFRDGHHTAFAVIEAGKDGTQPDGTAVPGVSAVPAGVTWGLTEAEVRQLDSNVRRTYADALMVARYPDAQAIAPLVRAAIAWDQGYPSGSSAHYRPTPAELDARLAADEALFAKATELSRPVLSASGHRGVYAPRALRFHFYLLLQIGDPAAPSLYKWVNALTYDSDAWVRRNVTGVLADSRAAVVTRGISFRGYAYQLGLLNEGWNRFSRGDLAHKIALKTLAERIASREDFPVPRA